MIKLFIILRGCKPEKKPKCASPITPTVIFLFSELCPSGRVKRPHIMTNILGLYVVQGTLSTSLEKTFYTFIPRAGSK